MSNEKEFIVAEVSKNWTRSEYIGDTSLLADAGMLISNKFEHVIEVNRQRGYELHSFQLHRTMTAFDEMNETIIAVFRKAGTIIDSRDVDEDDRSCD